MLKRGLALSLWGCRHQPPSGGCVLKLLRMLVVTTLICPAAFRRLCVETCLPFRGCIVMFQPPSGGCVLKRYLESVE